MNYSKKDFMIKLGETKAGDIIEIPDIIVYGLVLGFVFTLFIIAAQRDKNY